MTPEDSSSNIRTSMDQHSPSKQHTCQTYTRLTYIHQLKKMITDIVRRPTKAIFTGLVPTNFYVNASLYNPLDPIHISHIIYVMYTVYCIFIFMYVLILHADTYTHTIRNVYIHIYIYLVTYIFIYISTHTHTPHEGFFQVKGRRIVDFPGFRT